MLTIQDNLSAANSLSIGQASEEMACQYLQNEGLQIVERNYHCRNGEIDLIMQHHNSMVFVEVRFRRHSRFGSGAESVDGRKQEKIIKTAQHYLQTHKKAATLPARFDVIAITGNNNNKIEWIQDAFQA